MTLSAGQTARRFLAGLSTIRAWLGLLMTAQLLTACGDVCENTLVKSVASPDGQRRAVLFERNCGATTGFSTHISILDGDDRPSGSGNVFIANADNDVAASALWGGPWADVQWISATQLQLTHDAGAAVYKAKQQIGDIRVSYRKVDRPKQPQTLAD